MLRVTRYDATRKREWDDFVSLAKNGHFLFYRDYMDYHSQRFPDSSLMIHDQRGRLMGLLPATENDGVLLSHAGLTFGGVISGPGMKIAPMLDIFNCMCSELRERGIREVIYKVVPHMYHVLPAEEDLYALFRLGARLIRRDVSATIDRRARLPFSKGREWALKQAAKHDLSVEESFDFSGFMSIEEELLRTKYNARPTHTAAELQLLAGRFPRNIRLFVARKAGVMIAGVVIYETERVAHAQYIGSSEEGRAFGAVDLILKHLIDERYVEKDYFDFGISTEQGGRHLNVTLAENKQSYGARATVYDWYSLDLASAAEG